ncbi:UNVERIFIED_CONTAM: hypothetical protein GTU68_014608 [Idotea baltica]|nr:hypothetical protein [Idotea baltica]
MSVFKNLV